MSHSLECENRISVVEEEISKWGKWGKEWRKTRLKQRINRVLTEGYQGKFVPSEHSKARMTEIGRGGSEGEVREGSEREGEDIASIASWLADRADEADDSAMRSGVTSIPRSLKVLLIRLVQESSPDF